MLGRRAVNPWVLLAGVGIVLGAFLGGYYKGAKDKDADYQIELAKQHEEAMRRERLLQGYIDGLVQKATDDRDAIQRRLDTALVRLRNRPERLPEAARPDCAGATGRELSRRDAEFLERLAARAERNRLELIRCYAHVDAIEATMQ